ncbi:hypothetical protein CC80DRAFT_515786 [Byssothecium circinans]|uniref:Uncharacterized protein n=1 Tax=Byssothecium circinans TaxID=147558 RepID=A0A6A5TZ14_9PLEO|nr:hypothetical protein CC80DRAFT_515786 [Byssothecium circinans]
MLRAVKDLRDVFVRFNQATGWYQQYNWLEYLHALNLEQFDADNGNMAFCYRGMKRMFLQEGVATPPHIIIGNKMRFAKLGYRRASRWLDEFFYLVRLTHWILLYPLNKALIASIKESRTQSLTRRMMWFSAVFADPNMVALPFRELPKTLFNLVYQAHRRSSQEGACDQAWEALALLKACRNAGTKGFLPVWERGTPPTLSMQERIRGLSLDELDGLMVAFTQEQGAGGGGGIRVEAVPAASVTPSRRSLSIA